MLRLGLTILKRLLKQLTQKKEGIKNMTPEITQEYLETLQREYVYVSSCSTYASQKYKLLCNQGLNPNILQDVINKLMVRKTELEVHIYFIKDALSN